MVTPCTRRPSLTASRVQEPLIKQTTSLPGSTSLPTTGADILGMAVAALGCLGLGLGAMVIVRRRRNGEAR
jgi:LPXTG-motif cell wall-anchored protein